MNSDRPLIAKEGWGYIAIPLVLSVVVGLEYGVASSIPLIVLGLILIYMFRDPRRKIPSSPLAVLSPADGNISTVRTVHDPYLDRDAILVRITTPLAGAYVLRSPIEGKLLKVWNRIDPEDASIKNTGLCSTSGFAVWVQTDEEDDVVIAMYGQGLRRPRCYGVVGERIGHGQRCGFTPFGACIDVYLPASSRLDVKAGVVIHAGTGILGKLVHE